MQVTNQEMLLWEMHIAEGDSNFQKKQYLCALGHYRQAINLSEFLVHGYDDVEAAIKAMVTSYHNLADLYLKANEVELAECELNHVYEKLACLLKEQEARKDADLSKRAALLTHVSRCFFALQSHRKEYGLQANNAGSTPSFSHTALTVCDSPSAFKC